MRRPVSIQPRSRSVLSLSVTASREEPELLLGDGLGAARGQHEDPRRGFVLPRHSSSAPEIPTDGA